jgi:hypothetical protein
MDADHCADSDAAVDVSRLPHRDSRDCHHLLMNFSNCLWLFIRLCSPDKNRKMHLIRSLSAQFHSRSKFIKGGGAHYSTRSRHDPRYPRHPPTILGHLQCGEPSRAGGSRTTLMCVLCSPVGPTLPRRPCGLCPHDTTRARIASRRRLGLCEPGNAGYPLTALEKNSRTPSRSHSKSVPDDRDGPPSSVASCARQFGGRAMSEGKRDASVH